MNLVAASQRQRQRRWSRLGFFALFVLAPPLDLFRLDLDLGHLILFGQAWTLGGDALLAGEISAAQAALQMVLRGFVPIVLLVGTLFWVSRRYGRLYCGWLCPHFSVVEYINGLMRRASGSPTLWESPAAPARVDRPAAAQPDRRYWPLVLLAVAGFAFLWALVLLTYLLSPREIYANLWALDFTRNQTIFLGAASAVFAAEFLLARHLFCRFGCAVGLFQSYVWMFNDRALVVGFDHTRSTACADCDAACDRVCPMRLKPRSIKRRMYACTQCARCIEACSRVQAENPQGSLLQWVSGACALDVSTRDFGRRYDCEAPDCFLANRAPKASDDTGGCCGGGCAGAGER